MKPINNRIVYMRLSGMPSPYNPGGGEVPPGSIVSSDNQAFLVADGDITGVYRLHNTGDQVQEAIDRALQLDPAKVLTTDDKILFDCETSEEVQDEIWPRQQ